MLDFRKHSRRRSYPSVRDHWRPILVILGLGLLIVLADRVRDPAGRRLFRAAFEGPGAYEATPTAGGKRQIDNRLEPGPGERELPGVIVAPPPPAEAPEDATGRYFRGVKPEYLQAIRDDTIFRAEEQSAWFNLLGILKRTDEAALERAGARRVTYAQLFRQSSEYRGDLVCVQGRIRRAHRLRAPQNDCGIEAYYQTWLQPADNPSSPMVIYCLQLPEGFPTGMQLDEEVQVTGFFFKRWAYQAQDSLRTAPALVARTVHWQQRPVLAREAPNPGTLWWWGAAALAVSVAVIAAVYFVTRPRRLAGGPAKLPVDLWGVAEAAVEAPAASEVDGNKSCGPSH